MSEDSNENQSSTTTEIKPKRGRPRNPETATPNQIEAQFQELMNVLEEVEEPKTRTLEEIVEHNKKIITMVQNILISDLKTVSPKNTARITTPNGIQKFEIGGLHKDTRDYLLKILENCFKAVSIIEDKNNDNEKDNSLNIAKLANDIYRGIPGINKDGKKLTDKS